MINILRQPDDLQVICQNTNTDVVVDVSLNGRQLDLTVTANESKPKFIVLRWNGRVSEPTRVMGDKWERGYSDMSWHSLNGEIFMPWYFIASNGKDTACYGVKVQPNSFVSFQHDASGITAWVDVRCGAEGVALDGRTLNAASFVCKEYPNTKEFAAACDFCKIMSSNPVLPKEPVYGSNNWYYAYGKSSYEKIMTDAKLIAELSSQNKNKPFMVIDDGWQPNACDGPWVANEAFGDMKKVADGFKALGVKPGIWFRPLLDKEARENHPEWVMNQPGAKALDPSHPEVKEYLREVLRRIKGWGYRLVKHDFSTYDMFGDFGYDLNGMITIKKNWSFYDKTKTSAEIVLDFYKLIREELEGVVIIGCCTITHLAAGLVEIQRTGDDTSGKRWSRTRALGVNSLAFRMCQNNAFYKVDADCVGVLRNYIDWKLNRQWLDLLAKSGSPLFVSLQPEAVTEEMKKDLIEAFAVNSVQTDVAEPLDWTYNNTPQTWLINGKVTEYDFIMDSYPDLLEKNTQPFWDPYTK